MMRISIVTAVYNGERCISATLLSVAQQSHADIEHIIVDGASQDATLANVRAHGQRVAQVISEPDLGVYDAFNKGLRRASGEVIAFLNCGDSYASRDVVAKIAAELSDSVDAVFADVSIVDDADTMRVVRRYSSKHFKPDRMQFGLMPAHPTLFMRKSVYDRIGEYDRRFKIAGDFDLCLRAFAKRRTAYRYIEEPLVVMPRGGLSNQGWRSKWTITREMRLACRLAGVPTSFAKLCLRFPLKLMEMV